VLLLFGAGFVGLGARSMATDQIYQEALVAPTGPSPLSSLLDPSNPISQTVGALAQPGLMRPGSQGTAVPGLAASWKSSNGGARYSFTLPRDGRWSNGQPITTRDVGFTLAVLQSPNFPQSMVAAPWRGISLYATSFWSGTFVLPAAAPNFPTTAEVPLLPASSYHDRPQLFLAGDQRTTALFPPSAGPFTVAANTPDQVSLIRNPYFRPVPLLSGFDIDLEPSPAAVDALLAKGRVDGWLAATPQDLVGLPSGLVKQRILSFSFVELLMNEAAGPLSSAGVRRAIAAAVDRGRLIGAGLNGLAVPEYGPLPQSIGWARAGRSALGPLPSTEQSLRALGYQRPPPLGVFEKDGQRLSLTISVPNLEPLPQAAAEIAKMLDVEGFAVTVSVRAAGDFVSSTLGAENFQLALVGFDNGPDPNLTSFWGSGAPAGQSLNFSQAPVDAVLNHELDLLATASTVAAKQTAYRAVTLRLAQDMPAIFLYTPVEVYVHLSSVHVPGIPAGGDPAQRFADVTGWSL